MKYIYCLCNVIYIISSPIYLPKWFKGSGYSTRLCRQTTPDRYDLKAKWNIVADLGFWVKVLLLLVCILYYFRMWAFLPLHIFRSFIVRSNFSVLLIFLIILVLNLWFVCWGHLWSPLTEFSKFHQILPSTQRWI